MNSVFFFFFFPLPYFSGETFEIFLKKTFSDGRSSFFFSFFDFARVQIFVQNNLTGGDHPQEDLAKFG